jgi:hypothetical protein
VPEQQGRSPALHRAGGDERGGRAGQGAGQRRRGEDEQPGDEDPAPADPVDIDGRPVDLGRRHQRAFVGILVAARGEAVSADRLIEELALGHIAWYESHQPNGHQAAVDRFGTIVDTLLRINYRIGAAGTLLELGHLNQHAGATQAAITAYHRTLELAGDVRELQAEAFTGLVYCYRDLDDDARVDEFRQAALAIIEHRHHPGMQRIRATLEAASR